MQRKHDLEYIGPAATQWKPLAAMHYAYNILQGQNMMILLQFKENSLSWHDPSLAVETNYATPHTKQQTKLTPRTTRNNRRSQCTSMTRRQGERLMLLQSLPTCLHKGTNRAINVLLSGNGACKKFRSYNAGSSQNTTPPLNTKL